MNNNKLDSIIENNKSVTIVGASKTATDFIFNFYKNAYKVTWSYKENYWFLNETPYREMLKSKFNIFKLKYKFFYLLGNFFSRSKPQLAYWIWRLGNIIHTYGKKHTHFKKFHGGRIDDMQMSALKKYNDECSVIGEIKCFTQNGIKLKNGKDIQTDCVIFCTGSSFSKHLVTITVDDMPFPIENVDKMYA